MRVLISAAGAWVISEDHRHHQEAKINQSLPDRLRGAGSAQARSLCPLITYFVHFPSYLLSRFWEAERSRKLLTGKELSRTSIAMITNPRGPNKIQFRCWIFCSRRTVDRTYWKNNLYVGSLTSPAGTIWTVGCFGEPWRTLPSRAAISPDPGARTWGVQVSSNR